MKFEHITIMVKNMEESLKFYQEIIGLPVVMKFPAGPDMEIAFLGEGETSIELICNKHNDNINIGNDISLGFRVESLDETMKFVDEKGIALHSGPFHPNPKTKFFYILDPNGVKIQFIEH